MAKKFFSKYTNAEIESILDEASRSSATPFLLYYDKNNKMYRFFTTEAKQLAYEEAYLAGLVAGKGKSQYEFTEPFTAPAPNSMTIDLSPTAKRYYINTDSVVNLSFKFTTKEGEDIVKESVDVYYTFDTPTGTRSITEMYTSEVTQTSINIRDYLAVGDNTVTIVCKGRSTGASKTETIDFHILTLTLESTFDVAISVQPRSNFSAFFTMEGSPITKTVEACIDGVRISTYSTQSIKTTNREIKIQNMNGTYGSGKHVLQMRASMYVSAIGETFYTPILIYEFVISGGEQTNVMLEAGAPANPTIPTDIMLTAEQYVMTSFTWGFFTSVESRKTGGSIRWELRKSGSDTVILMNEKTQLVDSPNDRHQSPLQFVPTVVGTYQLHAIYEKDGTTPEDLTAPDGYAIEIAANTTGIVETTNNMVLKLSAVGRSNDEPQSSLSSWSYSYVSGVDEQERDVYTTYSTRFYNQSWGGSNGWVDSALCIGNGATCRINSKPFAIDSGIVINGVVFEIDFETYNVNDNDAILVRIGEKNEYTDKPYLYIRSQSATLVGSMKSAITVNFKKDERVKIAFIVYPNTSTTYGRCMFAMMNGVISQFIVYSDTENFNIGELAKTGDTYGMINIGNSNADAAIKIYTIRAYSSIYTFADGLANFLIDQSGSDLSQSITRNDIYENQIITYRKLSTRITTLLIDGDISKFLGGVIDADAAYVELTLTSPDDPTINFSCTRAKLTIAGQSTRGKPIPSMHVKLQDPSENIVKDCDGNVIPNNRWAFRAGNVPEKKFRLQANYMDSSCCHNAAFLKLYNSIIEDVKVNGKHVLMTPAQKYAKSFDEYDKAGYKEAMAAKYPDKTDPSGNNWAFPYEMKMVPDSIPCVVMWRANKDDSYAFLGQYVIMDEKKADFASCKRSIYNTITNAGYPDPFKFVSSGGERLWDNSNCRQIEIVETNNELSFFLSTSGWNNPVGDVTAHEKFFEMIYPDPDDINDDYTSGKSTKTVEDYWTEFKLAVMDKIAATSPRNGGSQAAFNALYETGLLHRWHWASYYCLMMRNCCVDSIVKNIELTTYDGVTWIPKWWDVDMQCGLEQTAVCDVQPLTNRSTVKDEINHIYYFDGRYYANGQLISSWLWDALEGCPQFQADVMTMDAALYDAGWKYEKLTAIQDNDYVKRWSENIYNESQISKYLDVGDATENALYVQGDRTPHRHWFLKTSYDYYNAKNVCGEYLNNVITVRTLGAVTGNKISIVPSEDSYFAWGILNAPRETGIIGKRGERLELVIKLDHADDATSLSNPLKIYNAAKISELDFSDIAKTVQGEVDFGDTDDNVGASNVTTFIFGVSGNDVMSSKNGFNISNGYREVLKGMSKMTRAETVSIRGMFAFINTSKLSLKNMTQLQYFYAAGTQLTEFSPARGAKYLKKLELPTTVLSLSFEDSNLTDSSGNCLIDWYHTNTGTADIIDPLTQTSEVLKLVVLNSSGTALSLDISVKDLVFGLVDAEEKRNMQSITFGAFYINVGATIPLNIIPATVPASLKTISLIGMGNDVGAQKLVVDWLRAVDTSPNYSFDDCTFAYSQMTWEGLATTDLMRIAKIPKASRRNLTGYIRCNAGPTGFSAQDMNEIINAFGANVFDVNNSLCIDCDSNVIIISTETSEYVSLDADGTINVIQGGICTLKAAGFPLNSSGVTYWWGQMENGSEITGTNENPVIAFGEHLFDCSTGVISSVECYETDKIYTFRVVKHVTGSVEVVTKSVNVRIKARTYPNKSTIVYASPNPVLTNNVYQILNSGSYLFDAEFTNTSSLSYNGTLSSTNGGSWSVITNPPTSYDEYLELQPTNGTSVPNSINTSYGEYKSPDIRLTLRVKKLPLAEFNFSIEHVSNWKNRMSLRSSYINVCLANEIYDILTSYESYGNVAMFNALEAAGFTHYKSVQGFTSQELKYVPANNTLNMAELLNSISTVAVGEFNHLSSSNWNGSSTYNVVQFLKNVTTLNLSGCSGLCENAVIRSVAYPNILNIDGTSNYRNIDMYGTGVGFGVEIGTNSSLYNIRYGTPKIVTVDRPSHLSKDSINVENTAYINKIKLVDINATTFKTYSKILSGGCPNLSSIAISSTGTTVETVSGDDIERITTKMKELTSRDSYSIGIRGSIHSQYAYTDSCCYLNGNFSEFHVTYDTRYIRWNDSRFEDYVADGIVGDGVGVTDARAARVTKLFGDIRGKADVTNLSDFGYFKSYVFSSYDSPSDSDFYGCSGLTTITIPTTASHIGRYNFTYQPKLTNVVLTHCTDLSSIDTSAFVGCNGVTSEFNMDGCSSTLVSADLRELPNISLFQMTNGSELQTLII